MTVLKVSITSAIHVASDLQKFKDKSLIQPSPVLNSSPAPRALIGCRGGVFRTLSFLQHASLLRSARRTELCISNNQVQFTLYRVLVVDVWYSHNSHFLSCGIKTGFRRICQQKDQLIRLFSSRYSDIRVRVYKLIDTYNQEMVVSS